MSKPKQIAWESWNALAEETMQSQDITMPEITQEDGFSELELPPEFFSPEFFSTQPRLVYTPLDLMGIPRRIKNEAIRQVGLLDGAQ